MMAQAKNTGDNTMSAKVEATMSKRRFTTLCQMGISSGVTCTSGACQMADCLTVPNTRSCMAGIIFTVASVVSTTVSSTFIVSTSERSMAIMTSSTFFSLTIFSMS